MPSESTSPSPTPADRRYRPGPHRVALCAAAFTWPLLLVGGSVTVYRVGMAVPDWPTTFGINMFLYNFWNASWGVFIEHGHRLYGSAVGLACIVLAVWFGLAERRGWMKAAGVVALLAVIAQGFLGGYRVRHNSTMLALVHGCTAQLFFAYMVALVVFTGRGWHDAGEPRPDPAHLRRRSLVTLGLVYAQVVAGAFLRHRGEYLVLHALLATAVWGHAAWLAWRIFGLRAEVAELWPSARAMAACVSAQVLLGVVAWAMLRPFDGIPRPVSSAQALVRIGHQGVGALLLAALVVQTLRSFRLLGSPTPDLAANPGRNARELEAIA